MSELAFEYPRPNVSIFPNLGNLFPIMQHDRQKVYYTTDGMSVKNRLTEFIEYKGVNPKTFEDTADLGNGYVNNAGDSIRSRTLEKISKAYPDLNTAWLLTGQGGMIKGEPENTNRNNIVSDTVVIGEMPGPGEDNTLIEVGVGRFIMVVPLVPIKAYAGYIDNYNNQEFFEGLGVHTLSVTSNYRGRYMAFVVKGESMSDGSEESINEGTIVTGREIQRHHWRNKLHLHRFEDYVIVHKDGIVTKRIIAHDVERGIITCHSLNPDKGRFPDYDISLDECLQIFNIVAVTKTK